MKREMKTSGLDMAIVLMNSHQLWLPVQDRCNQNSDKDGGPSFTRSYWQLRAAAGGRRIILSCFSCSSEKPHVHICTGGTKALTGKRREEHEAGRGVLKG